MRTPRFFGWLLCWGLVAGIGLWTWSRIRGQERPVSFTAPRIVVPTRVGERAVPVSPGAHPARDIAKLNLLQQQMYRSAMRSADWLYRANGSDGHFSYGFAPALKTGLEGDHYLRQAGAAFALARASRFCGDARYEARARQAILLLLADTGVDPKSPGMRTTTLPAEAVNRLAAAGMLLMAIHELPRPAEDLLQQSDQLCNYVRSRQTADGSLDGSVGATETASGTLDGVHSYAGAALYGVMLSQRQRPAGWKTDLVRKALAHDAPAWRARKNIAFVPYQMAAYAEAYLRTKEKPFADIVHEMAEWVAELQYPALDAQHPQWSGGFMGCAEGRAATLPPRIESAGLAEALADACRVARAAGDLERYRRHREALERSLQFLSRLQYTEANTQHFADWYRPALVGAFHASLQDGTVRLDYTQHGLSALVQYLLEVAE